MMVYEYFSQLKFRDKSGPGSDVQSAGSCCSEGGTIVSHGKLPWGNPWGNPWFPMDQWVGILFAVPQL